MGDRLGNLVRLREEINACWEDVRLARDYDEPAYELEAMGRLDALLDRHPRRKEPAP